VPLAEIDQDAIRHTETHTYCPYKGEASYYTIATADGELTAAIWTYAEPYDAVADALVVNETEAAALAGSADPTALLTLGPSVAVVTLGRRGATADDGTGRIDVPGFAVPSVDSVGAGDAFCGQFVLAHAAGTPLAEAVRRSCAAGALATTAPGAQSAGPTRARVEELMSHAA
jgi:ribokinase